MLEQTKTGAKRAFRNLSKKRVEAWPTVVVVGVDVVGMTDEVLEVVEVVEVDVDVEVDDDEDDATETDDEVVADVVSADNQTRQREMHTGLSCGGFHGDWGRKIGG